MLQVFNCHSCLGKNASSVYLKLIIIVEPITIPITLALTNLPVHYYALERVVIFRSFVSFFFFALSFANKRVVKSNVDNNLTDYLLIRY